MLRPRLLPARLPTTRLLSRRPLVFMDARDIYLTQTGEQGEGKELFLKIGSSKEAAPLTLSRYLS